MLFLGNATWEYTNSEPCPDILKLGRAFSEEFVIKERAFS
jgi:hypothetical protein